MHFVGRLIFLFVFLLSSFLSYGQTLKLFIYESDRSKPLQGVKVSLNGQEAGFSDFEGILSIQLDTVASEKDLEFAKEGFVTYRTRLFGIKVPELLEVKLGREVGDYAEIATITLDEGEGNDNRDSEVYSLLAASRDPLLQASAFQFGIFRFRNRGIDNQYNQLGFNGFLLNDLENGLLPFLIFSGQNQITRYSENRMTYQVAEEDFGAAGLNQWIQFDPRSYRKGLQFNYAVSNRSFSNRLGLQFVGHNVKHGTSLIAGFNRRWAEQGIYRGSFYDAFGGYLGISKAITEKSGLTFLAIWSPVVRGKNSPGVAEVYELSGDPLYNAYWGYQSGEIRNSRVANTSFPAFFLNYNFEAGPGFAFQSGIMSVQGKRSDSNLDWYNVADPRPDYYQKLPSFIQDSGAREIVRSLWSSDDRVRQVNWERFYDVNRSNYTTILNANGGSGSVQGNRSLYILSDRFNIPRDYEGFVRVRWSFGRNLLNSGYRLEFSQKDNYLRVADLLGGDFYLDKENFIDDENLADPDISSKNKLVREGDKYGYNYQARMIRNSLFAVWERRSRKWDLMAGSKLALRHDQRIGFFENAIFEGSLGNSEIHEGLQIQLKSSVTYKINGRNYLRGSSAWESLPPGFDQIFIHPAWRPDVLPSIANTKIFFSDLSYYYRSPLWRFQFGLFYAKFFDQIRKRDFFLDEELVLDSENSLSTGGLINGFYTGLDQEHAGFEFSSQIELGRGFEFLASGQLGRYLFASRPDFYIFDQFGKASVVQKIYLLNFFVPNTPQHALTGGLKFNFKRNGFAQLNLSYVDKNYVELNPLRRTESAVADIDRNDPVFRQFIDQEKLPAYLVVDANVYKSFIIYGRFLAVSLSVNNLLNNTSLRSGGFEQNRLDTKTLDPSQFPNKYFNLQGINFFLNLNLSLN